MLASSVIDAAAIELGDAAGARWTEAKLIGHLNSALDEMILIRPDAFAELRVIELAEGSVQSVPDDAARFLGAVRNMGTDGATPGRVIRAGDMAALDAFDPDWMSGQPSAEVLEAFFDESTPRQFFCYPPANDPLGGTPVNVQIRVAKIHDRITLVGDSLAVNDRFRVPLIYLVVGFAYQENTDVGSKQLAAQYEQQANALLAGGAKVDDSLPPGHKKDMA